MTYDGSPRLWRGTLNEDLSSGEADGDLLLLDGTDTGRDVTFLAAIIFDNPAVTNTTEIYALEQDGNFYIVNSECPV